MKKNGSGNKNVLHIFVVAQFAVILGLLVFITVLVSDRADNMPVEHIRAFLVGFCILILSIVAGAGIRMGQASKITAEKVNSKTRKYQEDLESIIYALPEGSEILTLDLNTDIIVSYRGTRDEFVRKMYDKSTGSMALCREKVFSQVKKPEQKVELASILDREMLLENFEDNEKEKTCSYSVRMDDGTVEIRKLKVSLLQNALTENIEAVIQIYDISDEYYKDVVGAYLALRQFKFTTLIFINSGRGRSLANNSEMGKENKFYDYDFFRKDIYDQLIDKNERDEFFKQIAADVVKEKLEEEEIYAVYVHGISEYGAKRYLKYEFQYIDEAREAVLLCVADETTVWETDVLTGLDNYKGFVSQAAFVLENSSENDEFAVLVTNIKWFKVINKIFGSARCDKFLKDYADMLRNSPLKPVVIGRFPSSDHFIMLVNRRTFSTDAIMELSHQHMQTGEREVDILVTCGIYNVSDKKGPVTAMVEHAIMAYKGIKDVYNIPYATFSEVEEERYLSGKLVVSGFEKALRDKEFLPFYQPIYDAVTHKVVSAEALVRWKKDGMFIPPGMFIPALEENGSVSRMDLYISDCVTEFLSCRKKNGKSVVPVSVNLSAMDFYATDTIESVMNDIDIMNENGITPRYEITETAWADASDNRNEIIERMRDKGTQILIDDFGSGYSSFSTIRDFNFDILKIDMGFIKKIGLNQKADGIVSSIIDMAHFIGLKVVAEGVETREHLDFLTEHRCDYIQGYYFSKPVPEDEFEKLLDEQ